MPFFAEGVLYQDKPNDCRYMNLYDSSSIGLNFVSISCSLGALGAPDHLCSSGADSGADC